MDEVRVEYKRLADLARWPRNPKEHDIPQLKASLKRWGFVLPLVEDETSGQLVAGHGRLQALLELQKEGESAPARVKVAADGSWSVPVVSGVAFADEREAEGYLLADNRLVEIGGWDYESLEAVLRDVAATEQGIAGTGYTQPDLNDLLKTIEAQAPAEFKEYDETIADEQPMRTARMTSCPKCGHEFSVA